MPPRLPRPEPRPVKIDIEHLPPSLVLVILGLNVVYDPCCGDQDVHLPEILYDLRKSRFYGRFVGYVARIGS